MVTTLKLKVNDTVKVLSGRDRGKQGKLTQVFPRLGMVVVEGVNIRVKHLKSRGKGKGGNRVQFNAPLPASKVALVCPHCSKAVRVAYKTAEDGRKLRFCRSCSQAITNQAV